MSHLFPSFAGFTYKTAIAFEEGVTRRDPSPVVYSGGNYHAWYSRSTNDSSGYAASVWHATSVDGHEWIERDEAISKGPRGSWDEHGVFTPTILVEEGEPGGSERFFLYYTAVAEPFTNDNGGPQGTKTAIGAAVSDSPGGPWVRIGETPLLRTRDDPSLFDSHRVDDACLIKREGMYWMYFKGRQLGGTPGETMMGVAFSDSPEGPFRKCEENPVIESGHEVCVWPHGDGVAALMAPVGPEGSTLQYSMDGMKFERIRSIDPPSAPGPYREDRWRESSGPGIRWGLCQDVRTQREWPYLLRFDCDLRGAPAPV
ncbi:MAG: xylosidase [Spirochaetales bacterium]|nr:xylosidase [Spirochaetales bacterium]